MTSSHEEDLRFFGQGISLTEKDAPRESFSQKETFDWDGVSYRLECDYDWDEKRIYVALHRNGALACNVLPELNDQIRSGPLGQQVQAALKSESSNLQAAFRLTRLVGNDPSYLNGLGLYLYTKNLWQEAQPLLEAAIRHGPDFSEAYSNLSNVFLKMGKPDQSLRLLEKAVQLNPGFADLHNALGWVYLECGRQVDARRHLEIATRLNPEYLEAYLNLCLSHLQSSANEDPHHALPAQSPALEVLTKIANKDAQLRQNLRQVSSWEEVSRQYLILKDRQARRDTTNSRAHCQLVYMRFMRDRDNLPQEVLVSAIAWLQTKLETGDDYADLRNYLAIFYTFLSSYAAEKAENDFQESSKLGYQGKHLKRGRKTAKRLRAVIAEVQPRLMA